MNTASPHEAFTDHLILALASQPAAQVAAAVDWADRCAFGLPEEELGDDEAPPAVALPVKAQGRHHRDFVAAVDAPF